MTTWDVLYPEEGLDQQVEKFAITRTTKNELPLISFPWKRKQIQLKHLGRKRDRIEREEKAGKMMERGGEGKARMRMVSDKERRFREDRGERHFS